LERLDLWEAEPDPSVLTVGEAISPTATILSGEPFHLWRAQIGGGSDGADGDHRESELRSLLSEEERRRAQRLRLPEVRARFVICRGLLRCLLRTYAHVPARDLIFDIGPFGKPRLVNPGLGWLHFNMAHTDDMLLIVIGRDRAVGVDVELIRPLEGVQTLISLLFAPQDRAIVRALPEAARRSAVLTAWTLTEAMGKAAGVGLPRALDWVELVLDPVTAYPASYQCQSTSPDCSDGACSYAARVIRLDRAHIGAVAVALRPGEPGCT
jgi:4'-phosphopantetheinyl transferase